jgi:hypothetical protein
MSIDSIIFTKSRYRIPSYYLNKSNASFTFNGSEAMSGNLPAGQNYLFVQHPMADNQFDFIVSGDYVRNLKLNNGTNVFKLTGPGSLQGSDAADALIVAISDQEANDHTLTNDTYTIVPFQVTDAGSLRRPRQQLIQPLRSSGRPSTPRSSTLSSGQSSWQREL